LLSACTSTPNKVADTSTPSQKTTLKPKKAAVSTWHEAYDEPQEAQENTLSAHPTPIATISTPLPITDVWDRVRQGLTISDYETLHEDSEQQLKWFASHPDYMLRVVNRAQPYLFYIVEEVQKRGLPMEVALLPIVESGFKPNAYSKSHAAGLWQFIPGTGRVYGLPQNWWYDGRRDVIASTQAALTYLEKLHQDFGDWQLAFAAYNCGEGTVARAIKRNQAQGKPIDFWSLKLPRETSAYVPKLMAVSHLIKFPERYELDLTPIDNRPFMDVVNVGSQIDLKIAAKMADVSLDTLYQLNPGFNRWATAPDGPHQLVLPVEKSAQFKAKLANLPAEARVKWDRHKIRSGETLGTIAQRYGTTVSVIKKANHLSGTTIRAGHHLLIPVSATANNTPPAPAALATKTTNTYKVKSGDTWWDIAREHDIPVTTLTAWNHASAKTVLRPGQELVIHVAENNERKSINYTIQHGDSLWGISRKFNVSVAQVREWNGLNERSLLQPGQNLTLYLEET
jgi:membrane-bound lytic murein transglycosylase D